MTRYVDGHPFPDDDSRTDAELRGAIARSEQEERRKRVARKHERRLAERRQIPPTPQGTPVIALDGVIGGGEAHGMPIGSKRR